LLLTRFVLNTIEREKSPDTACLKYIEEFYSSKRKLAHAKFVKPRQLSCLRMRKGRINTYGKTAEQIRNKKFIIFAF